MLKIRRPLGRLIFNMGIAIPGKTVFLIETAPRSTGLSKCIDAELPSYHNLPLNLQNTRSRTLHLYLKYSAYTIVSHCSTKRIGFSIGAPQLGLVYHGGFYFWFPPFRLSGLSWGSFSRVLAFSGTSTLSPPRVPSCTAITFFLRSRASPKLSHNFQGAVSIRKTVLPGMAIPMLKIRRPNGRLIFNMEIAIRR